MMKWSVHAIDVQPEFLVRFLYVPFECSDNSSNERLDIAYADRGT